MQDINDFSLLRLPQVEDKVGYKRAWIWKAVSEGNFPPPIKLGPKAVAWLNHEINDWINDRIRESRGAA